MGLGLKFWVWDIGLLDRFKRLGLMGVDFTGLGNKKPSWFGFQVGFGLWEQMLA